MREGGGRRDCLKYLKRGRGGDTKILKRGGYKLGQGVGALKSRTPIQTMITFVKL